MKYSPEFIDATRAELDRLVAPIRDAWPAVVALVDVLRRADVDVDLPDLTTPPERPVLSPGSVRPGGDDDVLPSPEPAAPEPSSRAEAPPAPTATPTPPAPPTPAPAPTCTVCGVTEPDHHPECVAYAEVKPKRKAPSRNPGADRMREIARERDDALFAALPDDGSWISIADARAKVGFPVGRATDAVNSLVAAGRIVDNGRMRSAKRIRRLHGPDGTPIPAGADVSTTPLVGVAAQKKAATLKAQAKARAGLDDAAIRDVILTLSQRPAGMTRAQLQKRLGIDKDSAVEVLRRYLERKVICAVPDERDGAEARYRYVKEMPKGPSSRPKHRPDVAAAAMRAAGLPVAGTGTASGSNGKVTSDKNIQQFLDECVRAGGSYEAMNGGHIRVIGPKGFSVVSKTAGSSNLSRTRASVKSHTGLAI